MDRSKKAFRNVTTGLLSKMVLMLLSFATRTIFIRLLGAEYTGVSSLYSNILNVLSLAELGVGNVLMFYMYSALKKGDEEEISALVREFQRIYHIIIICVLGVGLALVPFLKYILNSDLEQNELILYYLLYLINSCASYFVIYRTTVLNADQKSYISNITTTVCTVVKYILQIGYLLIFRNFLGYLVIEVMITISINLIVNSIAIRHYPYLKKKTTRKVNKDFKNDLIKNVKATFIFKVSDVILDQTDSIIISIMFGTVVVGYYTNYNLIGAYLGNIAGIIANGLLASYGNLNAEGNMKQSYKMLRCCMLLFSMFASYCIACYVCVVQDFIPIWIGSEYLMEFDLIIALMLVFYVRMVTNTVWIYRSTMGLFKEVQYINLLAACLNIVLSIVLGKWIGVAGVIAATGVSRLLTSFWYEGRVVFKKLEQPVSIYYLRQLKDFIGTAVIVIASVLSCSFIPLSGIIGIIVKVLLCTIITIAVELIVNGRSEEFQTLKIKLFSTLRLKR